MMFHRLDRPVFHSVEEYGRLFTDPDFWRSYVIEACARHGFACAALQPGLPGTNPVFLVDDQYVVKFFSDLFSGDVSFPIERDLYGLIARAGGIPAPALLGYGELFGTDGGWPWPYLITSVLPGRSITETPLAQPDLEGVVAWLAPVVRRIHHLPVEYTATLRPTWEQFEQFITRQQAQAITNHERWNSLPPHLHQQVASYTADALLLPRHERPLLLHADLNSDHVLVLERDGQYVPTGILDFGDARIGDMAYDLVAIHLGLFDCDKRLLQQFLEAYGLAPADWSPLLGRAAKMTVLHEFNVLGDVFERFPGAQRLPSLDALGNAIWNVRTPNLASA